MSETVNTQQMAQLLAHPVFTTFGWSSVGPLDQNWACVDQEKHNRKTVKTHPSDAVFRYYDPYRGLNIYLNTDLKSYKTSTLEKTDLGGTLRSLARATECANKSRQWAELYATDLDNWEVSGLLFIYNHDGAYDKDFNKILTELVPSDVPVAKGQTIYVLGPLEILYLDTVASDINMERGRKMLPQEEYCGFYYPDLEDSMAGKSHRHPSATIEILLGPWQLLRYEKHEVTGLKSGYYLYYRGRGRSVDEFKYLLDYIFKYQLLGDPDQISIRMPFACAEAAAVFGRAKIEYQQDFWSVGDGSPSDFTSRMERITIQPMMPVREQFSAVAIGMKLNE